MGTLASASGVILLLLTGIQVMGKASAYCTRPEAPHNMILIDEAYTKSSFPEGTSTQMKCDDFHEKVSGTGLVICAGWKWSKPDLVCRKKNCGVPRPQRNTIFDLSGGTTVGDTIKVSCEKGYQLYGMNYRVCYGSRWFGSSRCEVKDCHVPVPLPNMIVYVPKGTLYGATVEVSCEKGYNLIGSSIRKCEAEGWSGSARCESKRCEAPGELANGNSSWNVEDLPMFKQTIHYFCNKGYVLNGTSAVVCQENGEYDQPPPTCRLLTCKAPDKLANGGNSWNSEDSPTPGYTVHYLCNKGYVLNGTSALVCQENGEYDHPPPTCHLVRCSAHGELANGKSSWLVKHLRVGQTIQYSCDKGFVLNGSSAIVCQEDGEFDHPPPTCDVVTCKVPGELTNGNTSWQTEGPLTFGQTIHYVCHEGYTLNGTNVTVCQENGEFDHMPPTCYGHGDVLKRVGQLPIYAGLLVFATFIIALVLVGVVVVQVYKRVRTRTFYIGGGGEEEMLEFSFHVSLEEEPVK